MTRQNFLKPIVIALTLSVGQILCAQDDPSQRLLPLPERGVSSLPQHMELLKRLRSLVEDQKKQPAPNPGQPQKEVDSAQEQSAPIQPEQFQKLQDALKNFADKLPPGIVPPDLSSVPPEQLQKAMQNPLVQKQMRDMLQQFAKDGVLPPAGPDGSPLPLPSLPTPALPTPPSPAPSAPMPRFPFGQSPRPPETPTRETPTRETPASEPQTDVKPQRSSSDAAPESSKPRSATPESATPESSDSKTSGGRATDGSRNNRFRDNSNVRPQPSPETTEGNGIGNGSSESSSASEGESDGNAMPSGSLKALQDFLKGLTNPSGNSPNANDSPDAASPDSPSAQMPNSPPVRQPLRKRERSTAPPVNRSKMWPYTVPNEQPKSAPSDQMLNDQTLNDQMLDDQTLDKQGNNSSGTEANSSADAQPEVPSGRPSENSRPQSSPPTTTPLIGSPLVDKLRSGDSVVPEPSEFGQDPESRLQQLQALQQTLERMKEFAEKSNAADSSEFQPPTSRPGTSPSDLTPDRNSSKSVSPSANNSNPRKNAQPGPGVNRESSRMDSSNAPGLKPPTGNENRIDPNAFPEVSEFLREQLKNFKMPPTPSTPQGNASRGNQPSGPESTENSRVKMPQNSAPQIDRRSAEKNSSATPRSSQNSPPPIDVQKELAQKGFGETLRQIVERAKSESRKAPSSNPAGSEGKANGPSGVTPEMSDAMLRMLDGLKDDLAEIAKDTKFNPPPREKNRDIPRTADSQTRPDSTFNQLRKSASELLAGPKESRSANKPPMSGSSPTASNGSGSQFDFTPVLILAGLLAAAGLGFFGLRHLQTKRMADQAAQLSGPPIQPAEIKNRADVIRAFHEFAMQSTRSVQTWWTHRAVERVLAATAPDKKAAVATLADAYEQARYLPQDHELSSEQIQSARTALQQCAASAS